MQVGGAPKIMNKNSSIDFLIDHTSLSLLSGFFNNRFPLQESLPLGKINRSTLWGKFNRSVRLLHIYFFGVSGNYNIT